MPVNLLSTKSDALSVGDINFVDQLSIVPSGTFVVTTRYVTLSPSFTVVESNGRIVYVGAAGVVDKSAIISNDDNWATTGLLGLLSVLICTLNCSTPSVRVSAAATMLNVPLLDRTSKLPVRDAGVKSAALILEPIIDQYNKLSEKFGVVNVNVTPTKSPVIASVSPSFILATDLDNANTGFANPGVNILAASGAVTATLLPDA